MILAASAFCKKSIRLADHIAKKVIIWIFRFTEANEVWAAIDELDATHIFFFSILQKQMGFLWLFEKEPHKSLVSDAIVSRIGKREHDGP